MYAAHTYTHLHMLVVVAACLYLSCCLRLLLGHISFAEHYVEQQYL